MDVERTQLRPHRISRRTLLLGGLGALGGASLWPACRSDDDAPTPTPTTVVPSATPVAQVMGYDDPSRWAGRELVLATAVGEYADAQQVTIFEPFELLTGAKISVVELDLESLRRQVESADVGWSVCDVSAEDVLPLANAALLQEIDYDIVDGAYLYPATRMTHGVGASLFSTVLALRTDVYDNPQPSSWRDFWDLQRYPGARGLRRSPVGTLEFALLSTGMLLSELYPLNVDLAFEMLDLIRPSIFLWWEQGAQPVQMLASNDAALASAWHNRVERLSGEGAPIEICWNGSAVNAESWVVPAGAPELDMAMDFINFATRPEVSASFANHFPFGPSNQRAYEYLPPEAKNTLPGSPTLAPEQFTIDFEWWFSNGEETTERFEEWLSEEPPAPEE